MINLFTIHPDFIHWIDDVVVLLSGVVALVGYIIRIKDKIRKEFLEVFKAIEIDNQTILDTAKILNLKYAEKEIYKKIIKLDEI